VDDTSVARARQKGQIASSEATVTISDKCESDHPQIRRLDHSSKEVAISKSQAEASTVSMIPGVVDVLTGTTRRPSLLGAAHGKYGSPAKADTERPRATDAGRAFDPYWPPSHLIDVDDEDAVYQWAIEASMEDARRRGTAQAAMPRHRQKGDSSLVEEQQQPKRRCNDDLLLDRQRLALKRRPLDDLQIDHRRLKRRSRADQPILNIFNKKTCGSPSQEQAGGQSDATMESSLPQRRIVIADDVIFDRNRFRKRRLAGVPDDTGTGNAAAYKHARSSNRSDETAQRQTYETRVSQRHEARPFVAEYPVLNAQDAPT